MVALRVRRFDKTYEFKITFCKCVPFLMSAAAGSPSRNAVRADRDTHRSHDPPDRLTDTARITARTPPYCTVLYARNNREQRGAERSTHACARLQ